MTVIRREGASLDLRPDSGPNDAILSRKPMRPLWQIRRYFQIILTLLIREEEDRRRAPMESIMTIMEPVTLIATISILWLFLGRRSTSPLGANPILFYSTGLFGLYFFIYISQRMRRAIDPPTKRFPIERRLDHILVHIILRIGDYALLGVLLFGTIYLLFGPKTLPYDYASIALATAALVMLGFGWGIINLILTRALTLWGKVYPIFNRSLLLFSGILFVPDFMNPHVRHVLSFNPLLHAIALFRRGFFPTYPTLVLDTGYLAMCAIAAVAIGLVVERVTRRAE